MLTSTYLRPLKWTLNTSLRIGLFFSVFFVRKCSCARFTKYGLLKDNCSKLAMETTEGELENFQVLHITNNLVQSNVHITVTLGKLPGDHYVQGDRCM